MRNRMFIILGVIVVLFGALYFVVQSKNKTAIEKAGNPYEKEGLHQATIDQLDDPLYQNQITPGKLAEEIASNSDVTVYFYDPLCVHCKNTTPILVPLAESHNIDLKKMNLLEFEEEWQTYNIEGTPTLIHFSNGEEVARVEGAQEEELFDQFFKEHVLKEEDTDT